MIRRAKIVCTLGPASNTQEAVDALVAAGMDCARLNFSHGDHATHAAVAALVREAGAKARRPIAILADLCGPKMRIGRFAAGQVRLEPGDLFTLTTREVPGSATAVSVTYEPLPRDVKPGDDILLDDGLFRLRVVSIDGTDVHTEVIIGGVLSDKKGLNLPGAKLSAPALSEKDFADLAFATGVLKVDYVALSFVRKPEDVVLAKLHAGLTPVIAKIEMPEAIENLAAILDAADGAMVARGDLGVELGSEKVPLIQKRIIREVNTRGKIVITATQMLDSMIRNPRPTRAEAADVANAVLDGTDALMLSGETASGSYPVESVRMMDAIIREVERAAFAEKSHILNTPTLMEDWGFANSSARAAALLSMALPLAAIVAFTRSGRSAELLSEYRPIAPVIAVTSDSAVATRLALCWGLIPRVDMPPEDLEETLRIATSLLVREGLAKKGDAFAMVLGWPPSGGSNTVKLHRL